MTLNLVDTTESTLKGAIGELLAWKYLSVHRIQSYALYPYLELGINWDWKETKEKFSWLNAAQMEYLRRNDMRGPRRWDLVGLTGHIETIRTQSGGKKFVMDELYLFEVKTGSTRKDMGPRSIARKMPPGDEVERVKGLGFKPVLVKVQLADDWNFNISAIVL
jgi:hypothetical protein